MPSRDDEAIEQNRRNSILDLQLTGIPLTLHERPEVPFSRPGSRSEYLTRPMSAIPLYYKEKSKGGMRPRSAGPQSLRRKALQSASQYASPRSRTNSTTNLSAKGLCSRSELSLHTHTSRRGGRLEPGLASKPPLPPSRPNHTQSLDDIVNIKFLKWFPESAASDRDSKEVEEDEVVGRCDSSLGNDDISDLASSDSRLGFNSPDIALNTEGNLRPTRLRSPDQLPTHLLSRTNSIEDYVSPRPMDPLQSPRPLDAYISKTLESPQNVSLSETPSTPIYEQIKKLRAESIDTEQKPQSPVFSKRLNSRSNSASTSGSGSSGKKLSKTSRSISIESNESNCISVIDNTRFKDSEKGTNYIENEKMLKNTSENTDINAQGKGNLRFGSTTMFDSNESLFETSSRHQMFSTPESLISPEPLHNRQKVQRSKFPYRCRNATPDSLTTPEPSHTPEPSTSNRNTYNDNRKTKRVTIDCNTDKRSNEKASQDSGVSERDFSAIVDYDLLPTPNNDGKDKISVDSGVRSIITSVEGKTSSDNQPVSKHDEILSWMGNSLQESGEGGEVTSTYDELMNMIKVIEHDEVESIKLEALSTGRSTNNSACSNVPPSPSPSGHATRDILGLLEGVEEASRSVELHRGAGTDGQRSVELHRGAGTDGQRSVELHRGAGTDGQRSVELHHAAGTDGQRSVALAKRCMALSDRLEAERQKHAETCSELRQSKEELGKVKSQSESTISRHQAFINQLLKEKRALGEQCAALVKEVESKHRKALKTMEERHAVELKKQEEKLLAAEKIRREKWIDAKTKKIKEMTVAGVESELNRLSTTHQDEIKELRRHHEEELSRNEAVWSRRLSQAREESSREREAAVSEEREAARNRLQAEVSRLEGDQRDARRNLLQELRDERQRAELQMERTLADRSASLDAKYQQALVKLDEKLADINKQHEEELNRMREALENERESWLSHQTQALADKEREVKAEAKRERDRHIEAAIRKLDQESLDKQQVLENKLVRLKEGWEEERKELENEVRDLKRKLKECRREADDAKVECETARSRSRLESETAASQIAELKGRLAERSSGDSVAAERIADLQQQLNRARALHQEALADKQTQLDMLYNRVKEAVSKKDDQIRVLQKERDAALDQCRQLETIMERRTASTLDMD